VKLSTLILTATLFVAGHARAATTDCCPDHQCCDSGTCCVTLAATPQEPEPPPVREYARVFFANPVKVGDRVLFGAYLIEHDNDRMARGRPCTYIYKANDLRLPVVAFRCRHLHRAQRATSTITLRRLPDMAGNGSELLEFQFAGSTDGHGVPTKRRDQSSASLTRFMRHPGSR
jgi:hypothetical protein